MNTQLNGNHTQPEYEWELQEALHYSQPESLGEWEAETGYSWQNVLSGVQKAAKAAAPIAKQLAPIAARTLIEAIPRFRAISHPLTSNLLGQLVQQVVL